MFKKNLKDLFSNRSFVYQDEHNQNKKSDQLENITDIREYDVPYDVRVAIDLKLNVGLWYSVKGQGYDAPIIVPRSDLLASPVDILTQQKLALNTKIDLIY